LGDNVFNFVKYIKMTNLIPLGDYVLVEAIEEESITKSGIILSDTNKDKPSK